MQGFLLSIFKLLIHILLGQRSNDLDCPSSSPALSCGSQHLGALICFAVTVFPLLIRDNLISNNLPQCYLQVEVKVAQTKEALAMQGRNRMLARNYGEFVAMETSLTQMALIYNQN